MTIRTFRCTAGHVTRDECSFAGWPCPQCRAPVAYDWAMPGAGPLDAFAWPGGYPIIYLDHDGETLCAECAEVERDDPDSKPLQGRDIHYEGSPETCAECGAEIESAYGEPDDDTTNPQHNGATGPTENAP